MICNDGILTSLLVLLYVQGFGTFGLVVCLCLLVSGPDPLVWSYMFRSHLVFSVRAYGGFKNVCHVPFCLVFVSTQLLSCLFLFVCVSCVLLSASPFGPAPCNIARIAVFHNWAILKMQLQQHYRARGCVF